MARSQMSMKGMQRLQRKLNRLGEEGQRVKEKAVKAGAQVLKENIENHPNVPVSKRNKQHAKDHFLIEKVDNDTYEVGYDKDFFYLIFHEIGAKGGVYRSSDPDNPRLYETPDVQAKPFMRPTYDSGAVQEEINRVMGRVVAEELDL
jgi:HK97 gp10 family phage protein